MPAANQRIGEYVLTRQIGQGAFGEVWLASHHAWSQELAAVKIPTDPQFIRNLQQEGLAVRGLNHPNIVRAINFDPWADVPYLVMEYVPGQSLRSLIQQGPLRPEDAVAVMRQVLAALDHAHRAGLVHRDVKPENILIHERSRKKGLAGKGIVKLTDFGMGKAPARASGSIQMSQEANRPEKIGGTQQYIAPEQFDGASPDARSDLYACGVVLFEMLTGKRPVGTELPSETNANVPAYLDEAYRCAVARHERRFASAAKMFAALEPPAADGSQSSPEIASVAIVELGRAAASMVVGRPSPKKLFSDVVSTALWWKLMPALLAAVVLIGVGTWIWFNNERNADISNSQEPPVSAAVNTSPMPSLSAKPVLVHPPKTTEGNTQQQNDKQIQARAADRRETQRREQVADLLAAAKVDDTPEMGTEGLALLDELLDLDPNNSEAIGLKTRIQSTLEAERQRLAELRQQKIARLLATAKANNSPENGQDALVTLDELLKLDPNNIEAISLKTRIQSMLTEAERQRQAQLRQQKIVELLATAKANESKGKGQDALAALDDLLMLDPANAEASALRNKISAHYGPRKITNSIGMTLIEIKAGEFLMGSPANEDGHNAEEIQHKVKITKPFMLGVTAVTQKQWVALIENNPSNFKGDDLPVENITWDDAVAFCQKLSTKEGKKYRLPTEAQWEYACRSGTTTPYNTGNGEKALSNAGWYGTNSGSMTHPVGEKKANAWGLYDMHGNVWEWCNDYVALYPAGDAVDPVGPAQGDAMSLRILRGGSWELSPHECRAAYRGRYRQGLRNIDFGFRCLQELP